MTAPAAVDAVETHCPYCALQCGIVARTSPTLSVVGNRAFPVNAGALCAKGWNAAAVVDHPERLREPLARDRAGRLVPVGWRYALDRIALGIRDTIRTHGADAVGILGSGALTNEKAYLLGKFARVAVGTANIDYNGRYCMSSGAAATNKAFGLDRGLPFPLEDLAGADVVLLAGSNPAETMPPFVRYLDTLKGRGGALIVIDPRRSATAQLATLHLQPMPGSDTALANGLLHVLLRDGLANQAYIERRTEGFAKVRAVAAGYWPELVERVTGVPEKKIVEAARLLGTSARGYVLTGRGPEQQAQGVANALSYINIALACGFPGSEGSGFGTLTGQGNGQGGREHGQKADQLPGYRSHQRPGRAPRRRRRLARLAGVAARPGQVGLRAARELRHRRRRPRPVRDGLQRAGLVAVGRPDRDAARLARLPRRLRLLPLRDGQDGRRRPAFGAVGGRGRHDDQPRGPRHPPHARRRRADRRGVGHRRAGRPRRAPRQAQALRLQHAGRRLRRAAREPPGARRPTTRASPTPRSTPQRGVFWPCPSAEHTGTPRLFAGRFATPSGKARFHAVKHKLPAEAPDKDYPLYLTTGRVLAQYQSGTQTRRVPALNAMSGRAVAELHPQTAARFKVTDGSRLAVKTRRGSVDVTAKVTRDIRPDTIFMPFHWPDGQSANRLTNDALDPTSRMPEFKVCAARVDPLGPEDVSPAPRDLSKDTRS